MSAYKCNRCGALYESATVPDITIKEYYHGYGEERKNLCPLCQAELIKWLKKETVEIDIDSITLAEAVSVIDTIFNNPIIARRNGRSVRDTTLLIAWLKIKEALK